MSGPILGTLSKNRWSGGIKNASLVWGRFRRDTIDRAESWGMNFHMGPDFKKTYDRCARRRNSRAAGRGQPAVSGARSAAPCQPRCRQPSPTPTAPLLCWAASSSSSTTTTTQPSAACPPLPAALRSRAARSTLSRRGLDLMWVLASRPATKTCGKIPSSWTVEPPVFAVLQL
jgi:hypothetical protein